MNEMERIGQRLRDARRNVRLSQTATGAFVGVTRQTIAAFEAGKRSPSFAQVPALSSLFRVTADELLGARSLSRPSHVPTYLPRMNAGAEVEAHDVTELQTFEDYLISVGPRPLRVDFVRQPFESIETTAQRWRSEGAFGATLPVPVFDMLASLGVEVRFTSLASLAGALIPGSGERATGVVVNSDQPADRQRYTIAHELGHVVLQHEASAGCRTEMGRRFANPEVQADRFASELLVPTDVLRQEAADVSAQLGTKAPIEHVVYLLSRRFFVSFQAMTLRLDHLGALQPVDIARLESAKPLTIEKELGRLRREGTIPFVVDALPGLAARSLPPGWSQRPTSDTVRALQTAAVADYFSRVSEVERGDVAGSVYEKVALWVARTYPL